MILCRSAVKRLPVISYKFSLVGVSVATVRQLRLFKKV